MAIAYFSTWTTYGTWLPGDERNWFRSGSGIQGPDLARQFEAALCMKDDAVVLNGEQRLLIERTIADHCRIRHWLLHAVNCRTNHVHVVVTAVKVPLETPREQFKSWCTRRLREQFNLAQTIWTERGWDEYVDGDDHLLNAIRYVREGQDFR